MGRAAGRTNPIHQGDVAEHFVKLADTPRNGLEKIGGRDVLSIEEIAREAFKALSIPDGKFRRVPMWVMSAALAGMKIFSKPTYNIMSFLRLNMLYEEMVAPQVGSRHLSDFFAQLAAREPVAATRSQKSMGN
jgi:hypothetical protein